MVKASDVLVGAYYVAFIGSSVRQGIIDSRNGGFHPSIPLALAAAGSMGQAVVEADYAQKNYDTHAYRQFEGNKTPLRAGLESLLLCGIGTSIMAGVSYGIGYVCAGIRNSEEK